MNHDIGFHRFHFILVCCALNYASVIFISYLHHFLMQGAQLRKHIDATLGSGNLREAVRLPPGEDLNEWLAVNSNKLSLSCVCVCVRAHAQFSTLIGCLSS